MSYNAQACKYLLELLRCSINDKAPGNIPAELSWHEVYRLAGRHGVSALALHALRHQKDKIDPAVLQKWQNDYDTCLIKGANQQYALCQIMEAFSAQGIAHMPLKGSCIRGLFPVRELREMSDLDILIHDADMDRACEILCEMGFERGEDNGNHVILTKRPFLCVELHRELISRTCELQEVFRDPWQYCVKKENTMQYGLNREDFYLHLITHAAKHFFSCGVGIRSVLDVFLYLREYGSGLDWAYIDSRIRMDQLRSFRTGIEALSESWFGEKPVGSSVTEELSHYILNSATYGTRQGFEIQYIRQRVKEGKSVRSAKISYFLHMAFLPKSEMQLMYPSLEKAPVLLPFFWVHRWFKILIRKPNSIKKRYQQARNIAYFEKRD